jgi:hypothetical protein
MAIKSLTTSSVSTGIKRAKFWDQSSFLGFEILLVAGGGGAGGYCSGGGGAGGVLLHRGVSVPGATVLSVTVGNGGTNTQNGGNSSVTGPGLSLSEAIGGGYSGSGGGSGAATAQNGGSGGGGGTANGANNSGPFGLGTLGQGNNGGQPFGSFPGNYPSGGGGGASAVGENVNYQSTRGARGGNGTFAYATWASATGTGVNGYYAGGGGGFMSNNFSGGTVPGGFGGEGGGGKGAAGSASGAIIVNVTSGTPNTGGGAGGGGTTSNSNVGLSGGSGIVILRTQGNYTAASTSGSVTRVVSGGLTYYTFTGNGSLTV